MENLRYLAKNVLWTFSKVVTVQTSVNFRCIKQWARRWSGEDSTAAGKGGISEQTPKLCATFINTPKALLEAWRHAQRERPASRNIQHHKALSLPTITWIFTVITIRILNNEERWKSNLKKPRLYIKNKTIISSNASQKIRERDIPNTQYKILNLQNN